MSDTEFMLLLKKLHFSVLVHSEGSCTKISHLFLCDITTFFPCFLSPPGLDFCSSRKVISTVSVYSLCLLFFEVFHSNSHEARRSAITNHVHCKPFTMPIKVARYHTFRQSFYLNTFHSHVLNHCWELDLEVLSTCSSVCFISDYRSTT